MIILELMEFGDLKNFLIDNKYVCLLSPCCMAVMVQCTPSQSSHLKGYRSMIFQQLSHELLETGNILSINPSVYWNVCLKH